jgi:hypothetical protein
MRIIRNTDTVRTSQEAHYLSATEPNRLMLFEETVAVYWENHTEHVDTKHGAYCRVQYSKAGGTYSNHRVLKGLKA